MLRFGLLLSFFAVFLQVCVFLQTLLPQKYQISPVCETITLALSQPNNHFSDHNEHVSHQHGAHHQHAQQSLLLSESSSQSHEHDASHQCQYCTVYGNLVLPPDAEVKEVLAKISVQFIWLQQQFAHVYFALQRLFLLPQGRAPPVLI